MERDSPPLFRRLTFDEAVALCAKDSRLLLIDFTADWCAPCQTMDRTTWRAASVEEWVRKHAIAIQVDVDQEEAIARRFDVHAMPTMLLLRGETELDRATGGRSAEKLSEWLENARAGRTELDALRQVEPSDLHGRLHLARVLLMRGKIDESLDHLEWLWEHAVEVDPAWYGVRHSFLASVLSEAAQASLVARERIAIMRDNAGRDVEQLEPFRDWCTLNRALSDEAVTLAWFDHVKARPPASLQLDSDYTVIALLRSHGRWSDYGRLVQRPLDNLARSHQLVVDAKEELNRLTTEVEPGLPEHFLDSARHLFREEAGDLHRALVAAGRPDEALTVHDEALRLDPSNEMKKALGDPS